MGFGLYFNGTSKNYISIRYEKSQKSKTLKTANFKSTAMAESGLKVLLKNAIEYFVVYNQRA